MKLACLLVVTLLMGSQGEPVGRTIQNIIQGGQTLANMMMVTGARTMAPMVDAFLLMTQRFMDIGKKYMLHIDSMLSYMDMDPQMRQMAESMHMNLYDIETTLDALMQNSVWGGEVVKATADCVVPQVEAVTRVKDNAMRAVGTAIEEQKSFVEKLAAAGRSITEQMQGLQDTQDKVNLMIANGQSLEAMQFIIKNRQKSEKDGRLMESVYFGALDEYREATNGATKRLSDTLGKVYEEGDKIMQRLDNCIEPKISKMLKTEILNKKNKLGPKHIIPEQLKFFHNFPTTQVNPMQHALAVTPAPEVKPTTEIKPTQ